MQHTQENKAYLAAVLNACIIGLSFLFLKLTLTVVTNPIDTLAHRFTASFLGMLLFILFGWIKVRMKWKDMLQILPLALFYPAGFFALQVFGLVYTSSSEAGIIQATVPIFTLILAAIFLKEHTTPLQKLCTFLSVAGVIFIFLMKGTSVDLSNLKGTMLLLLSSLSFAGYSVLARPLTKKYTAMDLTFMMITIAFISFNLLALINHTMTGDFKSFLKPLTNPLFIVAIIYLGVLSSLVTALLSNYALSIIEASKMSVFSNLATLISMIAGAVFLHEKLTYYHIIGAIMIVLGVIGTNYFGKVTKHQVVSKKR